MDKSKVLDINIANLDIVKTAELIKSWLLQSGKKQVITANSEMLYLAHKDKEFRKILQNASIVTPDGIGVVWAAKLLDKPVAERVAGYDLMLKILEISDAKVFLLGAEAKVVKEAARKINGYRGISVAGYSDGYFESDDIVVEKINKAKPDIIFVALGCPKQEFWISKNLEELNVKVCMGVGGSFDVIAGNVKRAPKLWQRMGLEWLYRLIKQPSRFFRMLALPKFALLVLKTKLLKKD